MYRNQLSRRTQKRKKKNRLYLILYMGRDREGPFFIPPKSPQMGDLIVNPQMGTLKLSIENCFGNTLLPIWGGWEGSERNSCHDIKLLPFGINDDLSRERQNKIFTDPDLFH